MNTLWLAYKEYVHQVSVAVALFLILFLGIVVNVRIALGLAFPEGHDTWIWALVGLAGVNVAGMTAIRATGVSYVTAKAAGKASGGPDVNVEGNANITAERRGSVESVTATSMSYPQAGVRPRNPDVRQPLEEYAASYRPGVSSPPDSDAG